MCTSQRRKKRSWSHHLVHREENQIPNTDGLLDDHEGSAEESGEEYIDGYTEESLGEGAEEDQVSKRSRETNISVHHGLT